MKENMPLVSILINCYNGEKFLKEAINSVFAQTYELWEIIFWDNQSTDKSARIIKEYNDSRIKYFYAEKHTPLGEARSLAMTKCCGEYICILDVDDMWFPQKLQKQIDSIHCTEYAVCYTGFLEIDEHGNDIRHCIPRLKSGDVFQGLLKQFDINEGSVMIRKDALTKANLNFDINIVASEEYCLFMQLAIDYPFFIINEILVYWRIHHSLTDKSISRWAIEREYTLNLILMKRPIYFMKYWKEFRIALARAAYYKVRYYVSINEKSNAFKIIRPHIFVKIEYFLIFILLFFPNSVWFFFHSNKFKRAIIPKFLGITRVKKIG